MLLLLGQHSGTHEGHVRVVQEVQAERAVQHGADQGPRPGWVILEVPAQPACESHQLSRGWSAAPSLPQQPQEALHPVSGSAPASRTTVTATARAAHRLTARQATALQGPSRHRRLSHAGRRSADTDACYDFPFQSSFVWWVLSRHGFFSVLPPFRLRPIHRPHPGPPCLLSPFPPPVVHTQGNFVVLHSSSGLGQGRDPVRRGHQTSPASAPWMPRPLRAAGAWPTLLTFLQTGARGLAPPASDYCDFEGKKGQTFKKHKIGRIALIPRF